jgi:Kef-type K+ transport system membrane component KefB
MFKIVKPYLQKLKIKYEFEKGLNRPMITIIFLILLGSAYLTQLIGIHALFGAFLASIIMPQQPFLKKELINKLEDLCLSLLLPLFFVYTGLRTQISLLNTPYLWLILCLVVFVAIFGKFVGSTLAAKYVGLNWRDSISIGALMNTRGLMELIVLNIGYDLKILSAPIFTILVLMALITTFMTAPILSLAQKTKFVIIKSWRS